MNKRIQRGVSKEMDDGTQHDEMVSNQQYLGYTGHLSNPGMPNVANQYSHGNLANNTR